MPKFNIINSEAFEYLHLITYAISGDRFGSTYSVDIHSNNEKPTVTELNKQLDYNWELMIENNPNYQEQYQMFKKNYIVIQSCITLLNR